MDWFRCHHGTPFDPKWQVIAKRADVPRIYVAGIWGALLDCASQAEDRGDVSAFDAETVAAAFDIEEDAVRAVVSALTDKGLICGGRLAAWDRRQPKREDSSAERTAEYRRRKKANGHDDGNMDGDANRRDVTHGDAPRRAVTTEQNRAEQIREDRTTTPLPPPPSAPDPEVAVVTAASPQAQQVRKAFLALRSEHWPQECRPPGPTMTIEAQAQAYIDGGAPPELLAEILARQMAKSARQGRSAPSSLSAYRDSLADAAISHRGSTEPIRIDAEKAKAARIRELDAIVGARH